MEGEKVRFDFNPNGWTSAFIAEGRVIRDGGGLRIEGTLVYGSLVCNFTMTEITIAFRTKEPSTVTSAPKPPVGEKPESPPSAPDGPTICNSFQESDSGWTSVWTRRGNSDIFDANYTGPSGQRGGTVNTVSIKENVVTIQRTQSVDGNLCTYYGTIQADGTSVEGTYSCSTGGISSWRATGMICRSTANPAAQPVSSNCVVPNAVGTYTLTGNPSGVLAIDSVTGNRVVGRYGANENSLINTIEGNFLTGEKCNVLTGTFKNTAYNTTGQFTYTFSGSGFVGTWTDHLGFTGSWNGTKR
jgi:hypothetical protein